jgi:hypothetical protein
VPAIMVPAEGDGHDILHLGKPCTLGVPSSNPR